MQLRLDSRQLACALILLICAGVALAAAPAAPQKVAEIEGISEYRLANGLRVLLFPDQSKPTMVVNMTYLVGSRHEGYGETGMAHLLEHMLFKGTPKHPDIPKEFNGRGGRFNGTTSQDRTNYYELLQASDENLDWALSLEADRMVNSFVARKDLDSEMTVVRNEYERGENAPTGVLIKRLQSVAFDWHNYGNSTIGNRSDIENVDITNLQAFYRKYYQPDNAVLTLAGKFDAAQALSLVQKHFGPIPKPARALPVLWTVEPTQDGERSFTVRRVGDMQIVVVGYKIPSLLHADARAMSYAIQTLGDVPSGRLHKALVETGKAAQVTSGSLGGVDGGLAVVLAMVKKGDPVEPVREEMIRIVEEFAGNPPTAEEMERFRVRSANAAERTLADHENISLALSEYIALGDWRTFFVARDEAQKVTAEQVQAASRKYLLRDNRTVGLFLHEDSPLRAEIPKAATAAELVQNYQPKAATQVAEAFDPSPANIESRTKRVEVEGMKVSLLHKKTRSEMVQFRMSMPAGDLESLSGKGLIGAFAAQMPMRGTTRYTRTQLQDEFNKLKMAGSVSGSGVSFQTTGPNLPAAIRLAGHVARNPAFPQDEFDQLQKLLVTSIESQVSEPSTLASVAMSQHFNIYPKGDPRYEPTLQEQLAEVRGATLEGARNYYRQFSGAERAQVSIVGDFNEAEVLAALREAFGGWKSGAPWERIVSDYADIKPANLAIETPDKENALFLARLNLDLNVTDPDYPALFVANYIFGGGAGLDSRMMGRIRGKDGLSYGGGSGLGASFWGRAGSWSANATAAPQNVARIEAVFKEELERALKEGFTAEEVAKAQAGYSQNVAQQRAQDSFLVGRLQNHIDSGYNFLTWDKALEDRIMAVTPAQVSAAFRKYVDPAKITYVKAGDFAKAAATAQ